MTNPHPSPDRVEELREAYRDGLLTAARMVRRFMGERYGENSALMIDLDAGVQAHKPTLLYVAESIEQRANRSKLSHGSVVPNE